MHSPRVYFNNIGSICTDSLRHGNGLSALLLLTRAAKSSAAKSSAAKTCSMESRLNGTMKHDAMLHYASFAVKLLNSIYSDYVNSVFSYIIRFSLFLVIACII